MILSRARARTALCVEDSQLDWICTFGAMIARINVMHTKHGDTVPEVRTSMIKGKFVATIEIDIAIDENTPNLLPFEKMKEAVHNKMEVAVKDMLCEEFGDIATVKVTKTFADLYKTEDKHEAD